MFSVVLLVVYFLSERPTLTGTICVEPPLECPNVDITFWLYTKTNEKNPFQILVNDSESVRNGPWVNDAPIKILIHGYTGHKDYSPNREIRPVYLECCNYNIISVDYKPLAEEPCYIQAASNTKLVGKCIAYFIDELVNKYGFSLNQFHVIGFSLGGQVAGFTGQYVTSGKIFRITGLDPALPLFAIRSDDEKLDSSDALFVDVLHTNALEKGKLEASGQVDFFANGGIKQIGCAYSSETPSGCSHRRAPIYYAESITSKVGFYGTKCFSWITYMIGWCDLIESKDTAIFGEHVSREISGLYFFSTNAEAPFAQGPTNKQKVIQSVPFPQII